MKEVPNPAGQVSANPSGKERPNRARVLSLIAGVLMLLSGALVSTAIQSHREIYFLIVLGISVAVLFGGVMLSRAPEQHRKWGAIILVFSIVSLIGAGGFVIGMILGIIGGVLGMTWKPPSRAITQVVTRICPQCGWVLTPETKYCPNCGKAFASYAAPTVPQTQEALSFISLQKNKFCTNCGTQILPTAITCPNCKTHLQALFRVEGFYWDYWLTDSEVVKVKVFSRALYWIIFLVLLGLVGAIVSGVVRAIVASSRRREYAQLSIEELSTRGVIESRVPWSTVESAEMRGRTIVIRWNGKSETGATKQGDIVALQGFLRSKMRDKIKFRS